MSNSRNNSISMNDIYALVDAFETRTNSPPVPELATVREGDADGPETRNTFDLSEECWQLFRRILSDIRIPSLDEPYPCGQEGESGFQGRMEGCKPEPRKAFLAGCYNLQHRTITHFMTPAINPKQREIVRIHERMHAIHHLIPDRNDDIWEDMGQISEFDIELLAQLFTYKYLVSRNERALSSEMLNMSRNQGVPYKLYESYCHYSESECIDLYWNIRVHRGMRGDLPDLIKSVFGPDHPWQSQASGRKSSGHPGQPNAGGIFSGGSSNHGDNYSGPFGSTRLQNNAHAASIAYIFTYAPTGHSTDATACLASGRLRGKPAKSDEGPAPGAYGFLLVRDIAFIGIIEITGGWTNDPATPGEAFLPFKIVESWSPSVPYVLLKRFRSGHQISRPVYAIKNPDDTRMILLAHDAMLEGMNKTQTALRDHAHMVIDEIVRKACGG
jgi:hypothetical protein